MELKPVWFHPFREIHPCPTPLRFSGALLLLMLLLGGVLSAQPRPGTITLSFHEAPLETVFRQIQKQSGYTFIYTREQLQRASPVSVHLTSAPLPQVLEALFQHQPFTYVLEENYIAVKDKPPASLPAAERPTELRGTVTDEGGTPIPGATIAVRSSTRATATNAQGQFTLTGAGEKEVLVVTAVGYRTRELSAQANTPLQITLPRSVIQLDETLVIAYGTTTRRWSTGAVGKVGAAEIQQQPVTNALAALQGRVPGLLITPSSGLPGTGFSVQIRGPNSLKQGNAPLYIVDGVPLMLNSGTLSQISLSDIHHPLQALNPADIQSIEVLKDADATAIYGSQGANGVILITTKKGKAGRTKLDLNLYSGVGQVTQTVDLLTTEPYRAMRREAFAHDGITPSQATAPDLLLWDSTAYTDWKELLIGGRAHMTNAQLSLSGGSAATQFLFSGNYHWETTVFPFKEPSQRGTGRLLLTHAPTSRLSVQIASSYSVDHRRLPFNDLTRFIYLPPNTPPPFDAQGRTTWTDWVSGVDNPFALQNIRYHSSLDHVLAHAGVQYRILPSLAFRLSAGYNDMSLQERTHMPMAAQRPLPSTTGAHTLAHNRVSGYLIEPQTEFTYKKNHLNLTVLAGGTLQQRHQRGSAVNGTGYTSDELIASLSAAPEVTATNSSSLYRYIAAFGRINVRWRQKFLLNLGARRDGSSRFGPASRFSGFGSLGAGWIFSEETLVKNHLPFLSYGKIRGSYGVTGNDQIGDYQYLDGWTSTAPFSYQQAPGILPGRLYNPYFGWERNIKGEGALEIGLWNNRLLLTTAYYRNRSDNQLVHDKLPLVTGFTSILKNLDALLQNTGWEVEVTTQNIVHSSFQWSTGLNLTLPRNKLLAYPGLEASSDRLVYEVGKPVALYRHYQYLGIDKATGLYQFSDTNGDGALNASDLSFSTPAGPRFYGGLSNDVSYRGVLLSLFVQFVRQQGRNYLGSLTVPPGGFSNQPAAVLSRWTPGEATYRVQRFTATASPAARAYAHFQDSGGAISDASFVRLKNLTLSYSLPQKFLSSFRLSQLRLYAQGQNLVTLTRYQGADPEIRSPATLPLLRVFTAGLHLTL